MAGLAETRAWAAPAARVARAGTRPRLAVRAVAEVRPRPAAAAEAVARPHRVEPPAMGERLRLAAATVLAAPAAREAAAPAAPAAPAQAAATVATAAIRIPVDRRAAAAWPARAAPRRKAVRAATARAAAVQAAAARAAAVRAGSVTGGSGTARHRHRRQHRWLARAHRQRNEAARSEPARPSCCAARR
jgi:hypothetical protein